MDGRLVAASILMVLLGAAHSILGERLVVRPMQRIPQPELLGSDVFTKRTLRFVWHIMTVMAWGFAAVLWLEPTTTVRWILISTFAATAVLTVALSRGRHVSWVLEAAIAALIAASL